MASSKHNPVTFSDIRELQGGRVGFTMYVTFNPRLMSKKLCMEIADKRVRVGEVLINKKPFPVDAYVKVWIPLTRTQRKSIEQAIVNESFAKGSPILW